ncbi:MAG: ORF6N domain-containing protein [Treponemataceae bacterium]|nr:ORF6N domain-containing protein [Spirochaetales bacterium]MDY6030286.1 ORF6N domain-containing protein [Treponemataceae bacterium]
MSGYNCSLEKEITSVLVESKIFLIRGKQVMIDRDLAELYGVETKRITEAVKRNIERFPEEFRFQLTQDEMNELVANCDRFKALNYSMETSLITLYASTNRALRHAAFAELVKEVVLLK